MPTLKEHMKREKLTQDEALFILIKLHKIYLLAQHAEDEIGEIENVLRKKGNYCLDTKMYSKQLKAASSRMRNHFYKHLDEKQMEEFITNLDNLSETINNAIKDFYDNK